MEVEKKEKGQINLEESYIFRIWKKKEKEIRKRQLIRTHILRTFEWEREKEDKRYFYNRTGIRLNIFFLNLLTFF